MMNRKAIFLSALCLVALASSLLVGCQGAKGSGRRPLSRGSRLASRRLPPLKTSRRSNAASPLLEQFLKAEPGHPQADETSFRLGQLYLETGDFSAAYHLFRSFPEERPKARRQAEARLYLGVALYFLDKSADSLDVLHALADDPKATPWAEEIYRYIAENYVKLENLPSALTWYARCLESTAEEAGQERLQDRVLEVMSVGWEPGRPGRNRALPGGLPLGSSPPGRRGDLRSEGTASARRGPSHEDVGPASGGCLYPPHTRSSRQDGGKRADPGFVRSDVCSP